MVTKGDLGISYLFGSSLGLFVALFGYYTLARGEFWITAFGTVTATVLAGALFYIGYWLYVNDFGDDAVWQVSEWTAIGLAVPAFFGILLMVLPLDSPLESLIGALLINITVTGALAGVLIGTTIQLRKQHTAVLDLNRRKEVLNRVLRHNIRNDMNVLYGYVDRLTDDAAEREAVATRARRKINDVVELSKTARNIRKLEHADEPVPVDAATIARDRADTARTNYPEATIEVDAPEHAWATADPIVGVIVDELLRNAIEHCDRQPDVRIDIEITEETVDIAVSDNGPGIPDRQIELIRRDRETDLRHGNGLGLWLVKWFAESFDGDFRVDDREPRGTRVTVSLPRTDQQPSPD